MSLERSGPPDDGSGGEGGAAAAEAEAENARMRSTLAVMRAEMEALQVGSSCGSAGTGGFRARWCGKPLGSALE